jgi:hypothetical protein
LKPQGRFAKFPDNPVARHLALDEATIGPDGFRGKEQLRFRDQRLEHFGFKGCFQPDQFFHGWLDGCRQVALGLLHYF